nr:hypothetical protein [Tanacetum cinerariifolium]
NLDPFTIAGTFFANKNYFFIAMRPLFLPKDELEAGALELRKASFALNLLYMASKSLFIEFFITIAKGGLSPIFTFFNLPAGVELVFETEVLMLPLVGDEDGSLMMTPFKASSLNVDLDFKINLIVFGPEIGLVPANFSSRRRGVLQTKDSSAESSLVNEESETATGGLVVFLYDSSGEIGLVPANFSSRRRGVLQTKDSSVESSLVNEESETATGGLVVFLYDSYGGTLPVS